MISRDTDVGSLFLDHLQHGVEHTHNGTERRVVTLGEATQTIEMSEKLVRAVDEMNNHVGIISAKVHCA